MVDVHKRIHLEKKKTKKIHAPDQARYFEPDGTYTIRLRPDDPIPPVARSIADEAWLLCFDEFQASITLEQMSKEKKRDILISQMNILY